MSNDWMACNESEYVSVNSGGLGELRKTMKYLGVPAEIRSVRT
jgi:hypothetical protein